MRVIIKSNSCFLKFAMFSVVLSTVRNFFVSLRDFGLHIISNRKLTPNLIIGRCKVGSILFVIFLSCTPFTTRAALYYDFGFTNPTLEIDGRGSFGFALDGSLIDFELALTTAWNTDGYKYDLMDVSSTHFDLILGQGPVGWLVLKNTSSTFCNGVLGQGRCFLTGNQQDSGPIVAARGSLLGKENFNRGGSVAYRDFNSDGTGTILRIPEPDIFLLLTSGLIAFGFVFSIRKIQRTKVV